MSLSQESMLSRNRSSVLPSLLLKLLLCMSCLWEGGRWAKEASPLGTAGVREEQGAAEATAQAPPEVSPQDSIPSIKSALLHPWGPWERSEGRRPTQTGQGSGLGGSANRKHVPGELLPEAKPSSHSPAAPTFRSLPGSSPHLYQQALLSQPCS